MERKLIKILFCICTILFAAFFVPSVGRAENNKIILNNKQKTSIETTPVLQNNDLNNKVIDNAESIEYEEYEVPYNNFKSYMPYQINNKSIFLQSSKQYQLQEKAYSTMTGLRMINGHYSVAIGTGYKDIEIGDYAEVILENGTIIKIIVGDIKADIHTDPTNKITKHDNSAIEFIVDIDKLDKLAKQMGDISYLTESYQSQVVKIRFYNRNYFNEQSEEINEKN